MSKTYQAHISIYGSLILIGLEAVKLDTIVTSTVTHKSKNIMTLETFKKFGKTDMYYATLLVSSIFNLFINLFLQFLKGNSLIVLPYLHNLYQLIMQAVTL